MTAQTGVTPQRSPSGASRWLAVIVLIAAMWGMFLAVGAIGAGEDARGERVLGALQPAVDYIRTAGKDWSEWLLLNGGVIAKATTATAALIALVGLVVARLRAAPLFVLGAAVSLAVWGQVLLLSDSTTLGLWLYLGGVACAVVLGIGWPMARVGGFPELPLPRVRGETPGSAAAVPVRRGLPWWECVLLFALTTVGMLTRTYALPELPQHVDLEMIESMLSSRTWPGLKWWIADRLLTNSGGLIHLLPKQFIFELYGSSMYSLRLSAVLFGVAAIPLMYWLVRRLAGVGPAIASTVLLIASPEQLFWSRTENTHFAPVLVLALVTAHLGLWMVQRLSFPAVLAAALWTPFCRVFYGPAPVMFLYPAMLFGHALLFVRGAWRKSWYAAPLIVGGVLLWFLSLSAVYSYFLSITSDKWQWRSIDATNVYGSSAWRKQGEFRDAPLSDLVFLQAQSMTNNLILVAKGMTYRVGGLSHWFVRIDPSQGHLTVINAGRAVSAAIGLGYLLGQIYERRAFALLVWVGLALLPGIMSDDPADRRIALVFPALDVIAGVMFGTAARLVRYRAGRLLGWLTALVLAVAVAGTAGTNLVSHYLLPTSRNFMEGSTHFLKPLIEDSDAVFHNLNHEFMMGLVLGNADRFLAQPPCLESLQPKDWLSIALHPRCGFNDRAYSLTMPPERIEALRTAYNPQRVSFLIQELPYSRPQIALLRELFPRAQVREYRPTDEEIRLVAITVDIADIEALHRPVLHVGSEPVRPPVPLTGLLHGVTLAAADTTDRETTGIEIDGGLLVDRDGWYHIDVDPPCPEASITIDDPATPFAQGGPMLAGLHAFRIGLPQSTVCQLPLQLRIQAAGKTEWSPVPAELIVGPAVMAVREARAASVIPYPGYGEATIFAGLNGTLIDAGVDAQASVTALLRDGTTVRMQHFAADEHEDAKWEPQLPPSQNIYSMAIDRDGVSVVMGDQMVLFSRRDGAPIGPWKEPGVWTQEIAFWGTDRVLTAVRHMNSIAILSRDGHLLQHWVQFDGGPGVFEAPVNVTVAPNGDVLVIQEDGQALYFENSADTWAPKFVRQFRIGFSELPARPRGTVFDGQDRIISPDPPTSAPLVYTSAGERMIAADPARDLSAKGFGDVSRILVTAERLYVLDRTPRLWSVAR